VNLINSLKSYNINTESEILHNPSYETLFTETTDPSLEGYDRGILTESGAVCVNTGKFTGRSPKDKYIVKDSVTQDTLWWSDQGKNDNKAIDQTTWEHLKGLVTQQLSGKRLFVVDAFCGANQDTRMSVRFVTEVAWQAHFVTNMFITPSTEELACFEPDFVVMNTKNKGGQPLVSRLWGSGFLPGKHDGVRFRPDKNAVLYLNNPNGVSASTRRKALDALNTIHHQQLEKTSDPVLETRIAQYGMAFRMQTSVPEVTDLSNETEATFNLYGKDSKNPGTYAANCLMARRLAERGVKFIQLYHQGWDQHGSLAKKIGVQCRETDQASAALITDLKQRGMLDDTLVIWGGEFGRTNYSQGTLNSSFGRDHHPRCFTMWMAGGGIKPGITHGETDDYGYNVVKDGVHIHDLHATMMNQLGINHEQLTYKYQGRHFRLTDVHGHVVKEILS
jgi:hypothetical protein